MFSSFRSRTTFLCVAGSLLVPCAAFSQDLAPSITPADGAAPVPSSVTTSPVAPINSKPVIDSMEFRDTEVTEALSMLASSFKLPIAISGDVSGKIAYINLTGKTADEALNIIVRTAHLSCQKSEDGTYIVSPMAPEAVPTMGVGGGITPIFGSSNSNTGFSGTSNLQLPMSSTANMSSAAPTKVEELVPMGNGSDSKKRMYRMTINNVAPSIMAYWLDPANHEVPIQFQQQEKQNNTYLQSPIQKIAPEQNNASNFTNSLNAVGSSGATVGFNTNTQGVSPVPGPLASAGSFMNSNAEQVQTFADAQFGQGRGGGGNNGNNNGRGGQNGRNGNNGGVFQLPTGVDKIVAVDPQNALLVFGTPQGAQELSQTIAFLDKPLKQVEVETQFVSVNVSEAKGYGLDFTTALGNVDANATGLAPSPGNGALSVGFRRGNFQAALSAFANSSRSKVLASPRVLAINNLTASVTQSVQFPIVINTVQAAVGVGTVTQQGQNYSFVQANIQLAVTPTINNDGTITVLLSPTFTDTGLAASAAAQALGLPQFTTQSVQTIANVRDGETIALGGLRRKNITFNKTKVPLLGDLPLIGSIFTGRNISDSDTELIIFVKATIVHRAGDESDDVPGTALGTTP